MSWHHGSNILFATTVDSELWMWKIPDGKSNIFVGHGERAETAQVMDVFLIIPKSVSVVNCIFHRFCPTAGELWWATATVLLECSTSAPAR